MSERSPMKKAGLVENILIKLMPQSFALMQRSQSSIEIKQNAKGNVEFTVKCYADSVEEAQANGLQSFMDLQAKVSKMGGSSE